MVETLAASILVMLVSLSGKLLTWRGIGPLIEKNLHYLVSFAAGVMLLVAWNLASEIIEHAGSLRAGVPWIVLGSVFVVVAFRYIPQFHHHHESGDHSHSSIDVNRILVSDAIHNIGDGVVIFVSFAASPFLGIASTISIMVHEMLQEISEFFVYREAGMPVRKALILNFLTSSTILVGVFGAYFLLGWFEALEVPLLGLSVGAYLIVIFHDLIPHSISRIEGTRHVVHHLTFFLAGVVAMTSVVALLPHSA